MASAADVERRAAAGSNEFMLMDDDYGDHNDPKNTSPTSSQNMDFNNTGENISMHILLRVYLFCVLCLYAYALAFVAHTRCR